MSVRWFAAWYEAEPGGYVVKAATASPEGWSDPASLSDASAVSVDPQIAVETGGGAVAVWSSYEGADTQVKAAQRSGDTWSRPVTLSATGTSSPQVVVGGDGSYEAVWTRQEGTGRVVEVATLEHSMSEWAPPVAVSPSSADAVDPRVSVGPQGSVTVVWCAEDTDKPYAVYAASRSSSTSWTAPAQISPADVRRDRPRHRRSRRRVRRCDLGAVGRRAISSSCRASPLGQRCMGTFAIPVGRVRGGSAAGERQLWRGGSRLDVARRHRASPRDRKSDRAT